MKFINSRFEMQDDESQSQEQFLNRSVFLKTSFVSVCPHCRAKGEITILDRLNEQGPLTFRSDGNLFHLIAGDRPISYPAERSAKKSEMRSIGFWYVHDGNGPETETTVVILRRPPQDQIQVLRQIEMVADKLAEQLTKMVRLPTLYEFDGSRLVAKTY